MCMDPLLTEEFLLAFIKGFNSFQQLSKCYQKSLTLHSPNLNLDRDYQYSPPIYYGSNFSHSRLSSNQPKIETYNRIILLDSKKNRYQNNVAILYFGMHDRLQKL